MIFKGSDGSIFNYQIGGCSEAIYITTDDGENLTSLPASTDDYELHTADLELINLVLNKIISK